MKNLIIMIFALGIFIAGCGYKTNPVYLDQNTTIKSNK